MRAISSRSNLAAGTEESEDAKRIKEQLRADAQERATAAPTVSEAFVVAPSTRQQMDG